MIFHRNRDVQQYSCVFFIHLYLPTDLSLATKTPPISKISSTITTKCISKMNTIRMLAFFSSQLSFQVLVYLNAVALILMEIIVNIKKKKFSSLLFISCFICRLLLFFCFSRDQLTHTFYFIFLCVCVCSSASFSLLPFQHQMLIYFLFFIK